VGPGSRARPLAGAGGAAGAVHADRPGPRCPRPLAPHADRERLPSGGAAAGRLREGRFDWDPDGDDERERALETAEALRVYAGRIAAAWTSFLLDDEEALRAHDPLVRSPRGDVRYGELLDAQRWHASFHLRQLETALAGR
jgi:hypothetical protein